jgi:hypothetical protein
MTATGPSTPHPASQRSDSSPIYRALVGIGGQRFIAIANLFNTFVVRIAGSRYLRLYGVVQHRGRRSGHSYATPVAVRPTADGFVMPTAAGEGADWFQNLRAMGGGVIRWNGREYPIVDPVGIDWASARPWFGLLQRMVVALLGVQRFVRVRHATPWARDHAVSPILPVDICNAHEASSTPSLSDVDAR